MGDVLDRFEPEDAAKLRLLEQLEAAHAEIERLREALEKVAKEGVGYSYAEARAVARLALKGEKDDSLQTTDPA